MAEALHKQLAEEWVHKSNCWLPGCCAMTSHAVLTGACSWQDALDISTNIGQAELACFKETRWGTAITVAGGSL